MPIRTAPLAIILLLTAAALYASTHPTAAQPNDLLIEARITAERQDDNRVKVALELRRGDDWSERIQPQRRYLPADSPIDVWRYSDPLPPIDGVPGRIRIAARRIPYGHVELALRRDLGDGWGDLQLPRARQLDSARYGPYRFATSSIDLVDNGPQRCRLGLILTPGDRCRLPDTREELIVQADGVLRYPIDPYNARGVGSDDDGMLTPNDSSHYIVVPFLHGIPQGEATEGGVQIEPLGDGEYIILSLGRDRLRPANGGACVAGLLVPFGHYCGMPATFVWFAVYPEGPAHLTVPAHQLQWISEADPLHAEVSPWGNVGAHTVHAVREADGWRITTLDAPNPPLLPFTSTQRGTCTQGMILEPGQSCADPTSPSIYWVDPFGRWSWDDQPPTSESGGGASGFNQSGWGVGSFGFNALTGGRWLVSRISGVFPDLKHVGDCLVGRVIYPGERCHNADWFRVFRNGVAAFDRVADESRVHETFRIVDGGIIIGSYDFTAERQDDGGFRIVSVGMR